ncbi:unnamed protein product, partial [Ceratitis capitata]
MAQKKPSCSRQWCAAAATTTTTTPLLLPPLLSATSSSYTTLTAGWKLVALQRGEVVC